MTRIADLPADSFLLPADLMARLLTPALVVDLDRVRSNVSAMIGYLDGDLRRWRPHLKTTKMTAAWRELLDADIRRFKCATTREAAKLLDLIEAKRIDGADLLIAYPLIGPALDRAATLASTHPRTSVSILCESPDRARSTPRTLGVFVDVNPQMNRTGIPLHDLARIETVAHAAGDRFRGIHFYDGHIRMPDVEARRTQAWRLYDELVSIINRLRGAGLNVAEVITSGTLTFPMALSHEPLGHSGVDHQVSPGTVVFHDLSTELNAPELGFEPAAVVLSRVVSQPARDVITCDAGSKAMAAEAGDPCAAAIGWPGLESLKPSEEHLPMRILDGRVPDIGEVLALVPRHVCPTVNLADEAVVIEQGCEPRISQIEARGHETQLTPTI